MVDLRELEGSRSANRGACEGWRAGAVILSDAKADLTPCEITVGCVGRPGSVQL